MRISLSAEDFKALVSGETVSTKDDFNGESHLIALQDIGFEHMVTAILTAQVDQMMEKKR